MYKSPSERKMLKNNIKNYVRFSGRFFWVTGRVKDYRIGS